MENGRLDDHVASFAKASAFAKATADESEAKEQVEQVDGERVRGCGRCSEIPKIGLTIFLESGGLAGRECAGFDEVDGAAGDDGSGGVEDVQKFQKIGLTIFLEFGWRRGSRRGGERRRRD